MTALQPRIETALASMTRLRRAFDSRQRRERVLLIGAAIAVAFMLTDRLWLTPALAGWKAAHGRQGVAATALQKLNADIAQRGADAREEERQLSRDLLLWRDKVQQGDAALRSFGTSLVHAAEMLPLLDHMLTQVGGLHLRSMQSLPRTELAVPARGAEAASAPKGDAGPTLYRHGVELTVEGSYADLLAYLQALETMPQRVLWGGVQLKVEQYPKALLTLRLYTLSLDRGWLEL